MTMFLNSVASFNSPLLAKHWNVSRSYTGASTLKADSFAASPGTLFVSRKSIKYNRLSTSDNNQVATGTKKKESDNAEKLPSVNSLSKDIQLKSSATDELKPQTLVEPNGLSVPSEASTKTTSSPKTQRRASLSAREKLRAARVLSRNTESKPSKTQLGSKVLDALRDSDRGKKKSGLPEAPTDMLDDSKRGMPKQGLTFDFPGGFDLLLIVVSTVVISTLMFGTTYVVWKAGAIHFNDM